LANILITGANRGIGLELARQLAARGDTVIATCRSASPALDQLGVRVIEGVDITSDAAVSDLARQLGGTRLDVLINNAGLLTRESLDDLDFDRMRRQFEVNSLGPLRVTAALRSCLGDGSKVIIITSRMGSIDDNTSGGRYGYRMSKAAVNIAGKSLSVDLKGDGIAVAILHPGFVRTDMTGHEGLIDPPESASMLINRIDDLTIGTTGGFWHANGELLPW
jgi:NAD(P)-dependent dehydrogenase (short-subunit alcohol dehydrogenase family)